MEKLKYDLEIKNINADGYDCTADVIVKNNKTSKVSLSEKMRIVILHCELEEWYEREEDNNFTEDEVLDCCESMLYSIFDGCDTIQRYKEIIENFQ